MEPWLPYQERLRAAGGTALLVTRAATAAAVGGHERIAVYQSDPPFPTVFLPLDGPPHVCTPDPDGAMHLPADHVHPILFDPVALAARIPEWLGDSAGGPLYVDVSSPGAYERLAAALPGAELRDAAPILGPGEPAPPCDPDRPDVAAARRARFLDVAAREGVDGWSLRTPEAARAAGVEPVAHAAPEDLPDTGRVAVDRIALDELAALRAAHPRLEWVDAGPLVAAAALPRSEPELAVMRDGSERSEQALRDALPDLEVGMTEREAREVLRRAAQRSGCSRTTSTTCGACSRATGARHRGCAGAGPSTHRGCSSPASTGLRSATTWPSTSGSGSRAR